MDPRFPPLAPPDPAPARSIVLPFPLAALPFAEWAVFAAMLSLLMRM